MAKVPKGFFRPSKSIEWANGPTKCGEYLLRSSLAAALPVERRVLARRGWADENSGLVEHPATILISASTEDSIGGLCIHRVFPQLIRAGEARSDSQLVEIFDVFLNVVS